ncbi:hypothetical protein C7B63_15390 [Bacillus halotolerans]|nr:MULTISPECIES: SMI1/KNR4 family protein [Bacillus subtilis group]MEC1442102.1 SMI1/KNR4 family protein [Bacillus subtilis]PRP49815.1 hypothetical protein C7B63_15390 [Bacillus halotolerans]PRP54269.1 hypothetical protein C7B71_13265 [Bacillus halotolerans]PRP57956.1 hypothetical protein C7B66_15405 [Bacillus halotolerans]PRP62960.1 hypothetical protein C7B72_12985 [Bacillus halotolerans]
MNYSRVKKFFGENKKYSILTGGVTDKEIKEIEEDLRVTLSDSYKWVLTEYGSGGAFGTMILGYDSHGAEVVLSLDTNKTNNGECCYSLRYPRWLM